MRITPIDSNKTLTAKKTTTSTFGINFKGIKQPLVAISPETFKTDAARKIFNKIHKYLQILQTGGKVEDVKILNEELIFRSYKGEEFNSKFDTLMSIDKDPNKAFVKLYRRYPSNTKDCVFEAELDKYGQMVKGRYKYGYLKFERNNNNVRRMICDNQTHLPYGDNDREWGLTTEILPAFQRDGDNSTYGMYEIFIEAARLYTSFYK